NLFAPQRELVGCLWGWLVLVVAVVRAEHRTAVVLKVVVLRQADRQEVQRVHQGGVGLEEVQSPNVHDGVQDSLGDGRPCGGDARAGADHSAAWGDRCDGVSARTDAGGAGSGPRQVGDRGNRLWGGETTGAVQQAVDAGIAGARNQFDLFLTLHTLHTPLLNQRPNVGGVLDHFVGGPLEVGDLADLLG